MSVVPVLPASVCPEMCAAVPVPPVMFSSSTRVTVAATQSGIARLRCGFPQPASVSTLPFGSTTLVIAIGFE